MQIDLLMHMVAGIVLTLLIGYDLRAFPLLPRMLITVAIVLPIGLAKELLDECCTCIMFGLDWLGNFDIPDLMFFVAGMLLGIVIYGLVVHQYRAYHGGNLDRHRP